MLKYRSNENTQKAAGEKKPGRAPRAAAKIVQGLKEAIAVAKGEAEPAAVHIRPHVRPVKKQITLRLDVDIIEHFKGNASGSVGWQTLINAELRKAAKL